MKKYILAIFLILSLVGYVYAGMIIQSVSSGVSCDDCSGIVIHTWHAENSEDVTVGTPCGCADTDEVGTNNGSVAYSGTSSDGSYSLAPVASGDYVHFDETIGSEGTICVKMYATWSEFTDSTEIFSTYIDINNNISVHALGYDTDTVDFRFRYEGTSDYELRTKYDVPVTDSTWCTVCVSWDVNETAGSDKMWMWLDGDGDGIMDAAEYAETTDRSQDEMSGSSVELRYGSANTYLDGGADYLLDNTYVDSTYRNAAFVW